ncbi:MAG: hypothetical protein WBW31_01555, partial [Candidatus Sulfotelmatobacter sp.]
MHLARGGIRYAPSTVLSLALLLSFTMAESGCGGSPSAGTAPPSSTKSLTSILISPAAPTVALGQSHQLAATGVFSDGSQRDMTKTVTWASAK